MTFSVCPSDVEAFVSIRCSNYLVLVKWLLTAKDGDLNFRVRDVDCSGHPCPVDDVLRHLNLLY